MKVKLTGNTKLVAVPSQSAYYASGNLKFEEGKEYEVDPDTEKRLGFSGGGGVAIKTERDMYAYANPTSLTPEGRCASLDDEGHFTLYKVTTVTVKREVTADEI
jgi:hypothetical protein